MFERIVFLDLDGVVNSARWSPPEGFDYKNASEVDRYAQSFDPIATRRLNRLVDIGALFVLSSSWRYSFREDLSVMQQVLETRGFAGRLIDRTPLDSELRGDFKPVVHDGYSRFARGHEIGEWLNDHPTKRFVILDDDPDMMHLMPRLVRTFWKDGLLDAHVDLAIAMLTR